MLKSDGVFLTFLPIKKYVVEKAVPNSKLHKVGSRSDLDLDRESKCAPIENIFELVFC